MSPDATIEINMDARCTKCRRRGATPGGLCLRCIAKRIKEDPSLLREALVDAIRSAGR